jgi:cytidylate kinase
MTTMTPIIIAIDGPSASGKGTIARKLAAHFGYAHLDTGLIYRAVGLAVLRLAGDPADVAQAIGAAEKLDAERFLTLMDNPDLRADATSVAASKVAAIPQVRSILLDFQKNFCRYPPNNAPGAVLDGRDIGTVIAPDALVKIYVTASTDVRATRRLKELQGRGENASQETVLKDMQERDARDASRVAAPAKPADDAVILDTSNLTANEAFDEAVRIVKKKL